MASSTFASAAGPGPGQQVADGRLHPAEDRPTVLARPELAQALELDRVAGRRAGRVALDQLHVVGRQPAFR